jgi:16S rRNA (guanine1207-N2)-methyltransferase
MLSCIRFQPHDKVLDLGCGYGLIGIYAAKVIGAESVWMADSDRVAVESAVKNLALNGVEGVSVVMSDGFRQIRETNFTKIICNPPYHADFSVPKHFIEKGFNRLFGGARVHELDSYLVFEAVKRSFTYARQAARKPTLSGRPS